MKIKKLYTYPIKGLREVELDSTVVTKHGFPYDRRYIVLKIQDDGGYKAITPGHFSETALFFQSIDIPEDDDAFKGTITITFKPPGSEGRPRTLQIPLMPKTDDLEEIETINLHLSPTKAYKMDQRYCNWFSECFGFEVILAHLGPHLRKVLMSTSGNRWQTRSNGWLTSFITKASDIIAGIPYHPNEITFADVAPYLVVSEKSMEGVHRHLPVGESMDIRKFRPNIIVNGATDIWEEDYWGELTIGGKTRIECEHNCARCKSINIDYATGKPGLGETGMMLKKLNSDRRVDPGTKWSPVFGRYCFLHPDSDAQVIKVGDEVEVSRWNEERTRFGESMHNVSCCVLRFDGLMACARLGRVVY